VATVAALAVASLILLAMILPRPRPRRKKGEEPYELYYEPRKAPLTVVLFLILVALTPPGILAASIFWLDRPEVSLHGRSGGGGQSIPAAQRSEAVAPSPLTERVPRLASPITADLLGALALLAGFGSLGVMLWLRFGDRLGRLPFDDERPRAQLAAAVEESLEDLRLEPDARAAIIKCYEHFERVLAAAELPRSLWQTPVEFMSAALRKLPLPSRAVGSLTSLFEIARFSQHTVGAAERESALQSLVAIRAALVRSKETVNAAPA
jgi:Domain of unknown function (DUF4129)